MRVKNTNYSFYRVIFLLKTIGLVYIASVISSDMTTELSITFSRYLPFLQVDVLDSKYDVFLHE